MIPRNPEAFSRDQYDLVIIGGGIYGACLSLQAARCGLRSILLEREDFGGATSWNSLRILHGGLRYLQTLDLPRFRESVAERHWFCKHFPDLVRPLPCLMPLYGRGLKRKAAFGPALRLNDWLSSYRNDSVAESIRLPNGGILPAEQTLATFSRVNSAGLEAAGFWYDAMACLCGLIESNPTDQGLRRQRAHLLNQVGLSEVAKWDLRSIQAPVQ